MGLESFKCQLSYLEEVNVKVKELITGFHNRHSQVSSFLATEKPHIEHALTFGM